MHRSVVEPEWLKEHLGSDNSVKVFDVSYTLKPKPNRAEFMEKYYGKFEELSKDTPVNEAYAGEHIPGAHHFNLDVAMYPGEFEKFSLYPPNVFQNYLRLLGVNQDDTVIFYGRGNAAGMLFASRAWWLLKLEGFTKVFVLNGGIENWKTKGYPVDSNTVAQLPKGNWEAHNTSIDKSILITFDELNKKDAEGVSLFDECDKINYLDARPKAQFSGAEPLPMPAKDATGFHIRGAKNVPLDQLVTPEGFRSKEAIKSALHAAGYKEGVETVTACNGGIQAALLSLALDHVGYDSKLFNGSMIEVAARASHLINGK